MLKLNLLKEVNRSFLLLASSLLLIFGLFEDVLHLCLDLSIEILLLLIVNDAGELAINIVSFLLLLLGFHLVVI